MFSAFFFLAFVSLMFCFVVIWLTWRCISKDRHRWIEMCYLYLVPFIGLSIFQNECEERPFAILGLPTTYTFWIIVSIGHFLSRFMKSHLSPLAILFCAISLAAGSIFTLVTSLHLLGMVELLLFPLFNLIYIAPFIACAFILKELSVLSLYLGTERERELLPGLHHLIKRYNLIAVYFLVLPFVAVLQAVLYLFNQKPDSLVTQFTESCGFLFSHYQHCSCGGDHYLCSIAANGSKNLVRPVRYGVRKGERILVNRQLLISNAFEQWLEEKAPRFHKVIRNFYDGLKIPVNTWSKRKRLADLIYILMKPLEWLFLFWLYLTDPRPEARISRQYLPKELFNKDKK